MIIELYGLPGAGKTTFAQELAGRYGYEIIKIRRKSELIYYNLLFGARHPVKAVVLFYTLFRYAGGISLLYSKFTNLYLHHNAKYMKARKYKNAIIDQGHFQNIVSLFERTVELDVIKKYTQNFSSTDLLIVLDPDEKTLKNHIELRGYSAREYVSDQERDAWECASRENHSLFLEHIREVSVQTKILKNDEDIVEALEWLDPQKASMEIVYVTNARIPTEKAHGFQIVKTCEAFARGATLVTLLVPTRKNPITEDLFEYYGVEENFRVRYMRVLDSLRFVHRLGRFAYYLQAGMFFCVVALIPLRRQAIYYTRSPEVAWLLKIRGVRTVVCEMHFWPKSKQKLLSYFLRATDLVVCNSRGTEEKCREAGVGRTLVAPNGVDIERFQISLSQSEVRKRLDLPKNKKIVLYSGSFQGWKGVSTVLDAWKTLDAREDLCLVMVGGTIGDLESESLRQDAQRFKNAVFLGRQRSSKIPLFLASADMLLLPNIPSTEESIRFTSPIKMFEYMASGRPIIASDLPSIREILHEKNALFSTPGDPGSIAECITRLVGDSDLGHSLATQARRDVEQYSWRSRAGKIIDFLRLC